MHTVQMIARKYQVRPHTVLAWIKSGALAAVNVARNPATRPSWRVSDNALEEFDRRRRYTVTTPALIDTALALGWRLGITHEPGLPPEATREDLLAEAFAPAKYGRDIVILTGRRSKLWAIELRPTHGCTLEINAFPKTVMAVSPIRTLLFFAPPPDGLLSREATSLKGVVIHGEGSAVPLVGRDGWMGFKWTEGHAPDEIGLAEFPSQVQVAIWQTADGRKV